MDVDVELAAASSCCENKLVAKGHERSATSSSGGMVPFCYMGARRRAPAGPDNEGEHIAFIEEKGALHPSPSRSILSKLNPPSTIRRFASFLGAISADPVVPCLGD